MKKYSTAPQGKMSAVRSASLSSSEKKRLRDRRAQQTLREKRQNRIFELEAQVAFCEKNHGNQAEQSQSTYIQQLLDNVESLRRENNRLRQRQEHLRQMIVSWDMVDQAEADHDRQEIACPRQEAAENLIPEPLSEAYIATETIASETNNCPTFCSTHSQSSIDIDLLNAEKAINTVTTGVTAMSTRVSHFPVEPSGSSVAAHAIVHLPSPRDILQFPAPAWYRVPINTFKTNNSTVAAIRAAKWFERPDLIVACPPEPSPLDILHGSRRNYLADQIHEVVRLRDVRDAECLAMGYLIYTYSKWRVSPTPATFARLTPFQRPLPIQLEQDHLAGIDMIMWPQMRANMIKYWDRFDTHELIAYLCCCMKVRWPWGAEMLERDVDDNVQIKGDFKQIFLREDGWGLTAEFIDKFPEVVEGMDIEALRFGICLGE